MANTFSRRFIPSPARRYTRQLVRKIPAGQIACIDCATVGQYKEFCVLNSEFNKPYAVNMSIRPLAAKPDLIAQTHEAIRNAIMSGDLVPCAPLAQEELAERLGVSRQPISHALVLLKREGLVVDRGRKGQMVAPIDARKLLGLYQVRGALDRLAACLAAAVVPSSEKHKSDLLGLIERGKSAAAKGALGGVVDADIAFHKTLHALSGNAEIAITAAGFWPHMARSMRVVLEDKSAWSGIWTEHEAIAAAIIAGDAEHAGELAMRHAENAGETTYQRLLTL